MLRIDQARAFPRALGILLAVSFTAAGCGSVLAKSRVKKPVVEDTSWQTLQTPYAAPTPPPVRFFTINAVLARHDGLSRAKSDAVQLASVNAAATTKSDVTSDAPASPAIAPMISEEPFGLFTFRAPEGLLWVKWRGVEARMRTDAR